MKPKVIFIFGKIGSDYEEVAKEITEEYPQVSLIHNYKTSKTNVFGFENISLQKRRKTIMNFIHYEGNYEYCIDYSDFENLEDNKIYIALVRPEWIENLFRLGDFNYLPVYVVKDERTRLKNALNKRLEITPTDICNIFLEQNETCKTCPQSKNFYTKESVDSVLCESFEELNTNERFLKFIGEI